MASTSAQDASPGDGDVARATPLAVKLAYAAPAVPMQMLNFASLGVLPAYYAKNTDTTLAAIGLVLVSTRIFDAVIHPLVGFVSDRTMRWGGRKVWVMAGSLISAATVYFLYSPPPNAGAGYFALWSVLLYIGRTLVEIPHGAWGAELSRDYRERSRIFSLTAQTRMAGVLLFVGIPLLPVFASSDLTKPPILHVIGIVLAVLLPAAALVAIAFAPAGAAIPTQQSTLKGLLKSVRNNRPIWLFGAVFALSGVGVGLYNSVHLLYLSTYLQLGDKFSYFSFSYYFLAVPMLAVWGWVMNRIGKHRAWALSLGGWALILPLYMFIRPGPDAFALAMGMAVLAAVSATANVVAPPATLGDIIDFDVLKTGVNRAGNYFALLQFVSTAEVAIGGGLGFLLLAAFHINPKGHNDAHAVFGLQLTFALLPAVFYLAAALLLLKFPIDARRHKLIRRRLQSRTDRAARAAQA